jgi:DNA-directed RNA polymerase subunit RPC12/RpoP
MWRLKGCPHCRGDIFVEKDIVAGQMFICLQCGREFYPPTTEKFPSKPMS